MQVVNSLDELPQAKRRKIKSEMLRALLFKMESKPHISDEQFLRILGTSRQKIYLRCPWLHPSVRHKL